MYNKIINAYATDSGHQTDILVHINRPYYDGDLPETEERVYIQCWVNELFYAEVFTFDKLQQARNFVRDFSTVSATDFLDRAVDYLGESLEAEAEAAGA